MKRTRMRPVFVNQLFCTRISQVCGVGVAHMAKIGGVRMLDGKINDHIEGMSLQHAHDLYLKSLCL